MGAYQRLSLDLTSYAVHLAAKQTVLSVVSLVKTDPNGASGV
jgi:hypothetical protein